MCCKWLGKSGFSNFLLDMGERPEGKTLDRLDSNGGYRPDNCKWSTPTEQQLNTRVVNLLTFKGTTKSLATWARDLGMELQTLHRRIKNGWTIDRALTQAVDARKGSKGIAKGGK